jgi:hypothetical protein
MMHIMLLNEAVVIMFEGGDSYSFSYLVMAFLYGFYFIVTFVCCVAAVKRVPVHFIKEVICFILGDRLTRHYW